MGRMNMRPREADQPKRELGAVWGGVGCLLVLVFTVGCYFLADWGIGAINQANRAQPFLPSNLRSGIPRQIVTVFDYSVPPATKIGGVPVPRPVDRILIRFDLVAMAFTLILGLIASALLSLVWALLHPRNLGPKDAPPVRPRNNNRNNVR